MSLHISTVTAVHATTIRVSSSDENALQLSTHKIIRDSIAKYLLNNIMFIYVMYLYVTFSSVIYLYGKCGTFSLVPLLVLRNVPYPTSIGRSTVVK